MHRLKLTRCSLVAVMLLAAGLAYNPNAGAQASEPQSASPTTAPASSTKNDEVRILKDQLALQQKQIDQLQKALEDQKQLLQTIQMNQAGTTTQAASTTNQSAARGQASPSPNLGPSLGQVASLTPVIPVAAPVTAPAPSPNPPHPPAEETSPLQIHIGDAYLTPVGFMDFTSVWRSHDGGSGIGTNFAGIPYGTVYQNSLSEFRLSMQNSRVGFRVDALVKGAHVIGYMENDFLGNNPGNVAVSSNSNTMRSRVYWVDVRKSNWEVLGGQTWSLITPGRSGISPLPSNLFFTQNIDVNYQLGLVWGRIPELRVVYHPSDKVALAFALDSAEQYAGGSSGGGLVTFPATLSSSYSNQLNVGTNTLAVPNVAPDIIAKLALDPSSKFHFEVGGVARFFKVWNPTNSTNYSASGGGGFLNLNFELAKGFRIVTNNFVSDGGGRYIFGQAPDLIAQADGSLSLVHADSTVSGFEYTHKNTMVYAYYGGLYVGRNVAIVSTTTTSGTPPMTTTKLTPVGYGYGGSPSGQNRAVQEATFGFNQTIWKDPKWGAINFMGQYSYLTRNPWSVATGQPLNASLNMVFFNLRYTLPGSAPTLK
jgi:TolA-binding protein